MAEDKIEELPWQYGGATIGDARLAISRLRPEVGQLGGQGDDDFFYFEIGGERIAEARLIVRGPGNSFWEIRVAKRP